MATSKSPASSPLSRRGCALGCGLWLVIMALPVLAFVLATQNEIGWARGPGDLVQDKVFLVNEPQAGGLGFLSARVMADTGAADGEVCVRTTVAYLLWRNAEGGDPNVAFCQCYTRTADGLYQLDRSICPETD
jgi:hypothetical protein